MEDVSTDFSADVSHAVRSAIASTCQLDVAEVRTELGIDDLGLDSMGLTAVIARLEAAYQREFNADQVVSLLEAATVGEFADVVTTLVNGKG